jgi:hypothetical protein
VTGLSRFRRPSLLPMAGFRTAPHVRVLSGAHAIRLATVARSLDSAQMPRKRWTRVVGAFLASWFTLAASEHAPLNPCPMHGGLALPSVGAPAIAHADSHLQADVVPVQSGHDNTPAMTFD